MLTSRDGPDQARSWAVALGGFVINMMLSGICRTTGQFYVSLINIYGVSRMQANLPFIMRSIVRNLLGPVVGVIGQRYGSRGATVLGGLFAASGISLCAFAPDVTWIGVFWGGMHGIGAALGSTLFHITVQEYFKKHKATASGISLSGECVGSFVFPILLEYMLDNVGLSGSFLLTGAIVLHVVPAGIIMVTPPWLDQQQKRGDQKLNSRASLSHAQKIKTENKENLPYEPEGVSVINLKITSSSSNLDSFNQEGKIKILRGMENDAFENTENDQGRKKSKDHAVPMATGTAQTSVWKSLKMMCCHPMFHLISLSLAVLLTLFDLYMIVIVDYMVDKGLPETSGKYFISVMSLGDLIGRLCLGSVIDRNWMTAARFMMLIGVVQGLAFGLIPVFNSFSILIVIVFFCGFAGGGNIIMHPILVAKYLTSIQLLSVGCASFVGGIASFGIPLLIGYFRDTVGSYDILYYILGGLSIGTGLTWLAEPSLLRIISEKK